MKINLYSKMTNYSFRQITQFAQLTKFKISHIAVLKFFITEKYRILTLQN